MLKIPFSGMPAIVVDKIRNSSQIIRYDLTLRNEKCPHLRYLLSPRATASELSKTLICLESETFPNFCELNKAKEKLSIISGNCTIV